MADVVNGYFRMFYPQDYATNWRSVSAGVLGLMREYAGDRDKWDVIFPRMVCADGFNFSVQGHKGAYSQPRDDFADHYSAVEVLGPKLDEEFGKTGETCGDEWLYGYVPIEKVAAVIVKHGGLVPAEDKGAPP